MVMSGLYSVVHLGFLYLIPKHYTKSNNKNIIVEHCVKVINLVHKNVKKICHTESVYHSVTFNLTKR